jgi:hypothetical protein
MTPFQTVPVFPSLMPWASEDIFQPFQVRVLERLRKAIRYSCHRRSEHLNSCGGVLAKGAIIDPSFVFLRRRVGPFHRGFSVGRVECDRVPVVEIRKGP